MNRTLDWAWPAAITVVIAWGVLAWLCGDALEHLAPGGLLAHRVAAAVVAPALTVALWVRLERGEHGRARRQ